MPRGAWSLRGASAILALAQSPSAYRTWNSLCTCVPVHETWVKAADVDENADESGACLRRSVLSVPSTRRDDALRGPAKGGSELD